MKNYNDFSKYSYIPLTRISSTYWCVNVEELEDSFKKIEKIISLPIVTIFSRYSIFFDKYSNKYDKEIDKNKLKKEISNFKEKIGDLYCYVGLKISYDKINYIGHGTKYEDIDPRNFKINLYWGWNPLIIFFKNFEPIYGNRMFNIDHKFGGYVNCNKEEVNLYISAIENIKKYNL
jgi:hypothetical protein